MLNSFVFLHRKCNKVNKKSRLKFWNEENPISKRTCFIHQIPLSKIQRRHWWISKFRFYTRTTCQGYSTSFFDETQRKWRHVAFDFFCWFTFYEDSYIQNATLKLKSLTIDSWCFIQSLRYRSEDNKETKKLIKKWFLVLYNLPCGYYYPLCHEFNYMGILDSQRRDWAFSFGIHTTERMFIICIVKRSSLSPCLKRVILLSLFLSLCLCVAPAVPPHPQQLLAIICIALLRYYNLSFGGELNQASYHDRYLFGVMTIGGMLLVTIPIFVAHLFGSEIRPGLVYTHSHFWLDIF